MFNVRSRPYSRVITTSIRNRLEEVKKTRAVGFVILFGHAQKQLRKPTTNRTQATDTAYKDVRTSLYNNTPPTLGFVPETVIYSSGSTS
jgi:hypothetical protein